MMLRLAELEEARDLLLNVSLKDGACVACFRFGEVAFPVELEEQLRELIGHEAVVLRMDGRFYVRGVGNA